MALPRMMPDPHRTELLQVPGPQDEACDVALERLARMAMLGTGWEAAAIVLLGADEACLVAHSHGEAGGRWPLAGSPWAAALDDPGLLVVPDAALDARFAGYPPCVGARPSGAYAGQPVVVDGVVVAVACVMDASPRALPQAGRAVLADVAGLLAELLSLRDRHVRAMETEEALRRSEARFRALGGLSADWFWELDSEFRLVEVVGGPASRRDIGAKTRVGKRPWEDTEAGVDPAVWARHRAQLEAHEPFRDFEIQADGGAGGVRQVLSICGEPVFDEAGRFTGYRGVGRNITEQRRARQERELLEAQLREAQKMEAIGVLAGGIAHDFNNVVAGILGNVALALQDLPPGHPCTVSLEQIRKAGLRGRGLVQQILAFARRQPREVAHCALHPLVEESVDLLRATLPAGVQFESELADEPLHVLADATQVGQVLMNLCTNAWHALEGPTGRIAIGLKRVELEAAAARRIAATLPAGRYACLSVSDNGRGMSTETRARIFEPFFTTKPVGEGTGLGLAVAHGIVAAHGGAIGVDSAQGVGSVFRIYLPLVDDIAPAARALPFATSPRGRGERVLYVDDDEVMVVMVERLLQRLGYDVVCHHDPHAALAAVRARPDAFDIAVTDLNMPGLSGLDVARELGRLREDLPVVISSGNLPEELQDDARSAGVRALLHKQYTLEELGPVIDWVLAGGRRLAHEPLQRASHATPSP